LLLLLIDGLDLLLCFLSELLEFLFHTAYFVSGLTVLVVFEGLLLRFPDLLEGLLLLLKGLELALQVLELVFLLNDLIDVVLAVQISAQFADFCLVLLNSEFLVLEFLFEFDDALVLLALPRNLLLLLAVLFLLYDFVHLGGEFLELPFQFDVLLDEFGLAGLERRYALFSAIC
jgi:hypothetical protein